MRSLSKDKKGEGDEGISLMTVIELILFVAVLIGIIIPVMLGIWEFFINRPDAAMLKQVSTLQIEINSIGAKTREFPIFLREPFKIQAYKESKLCAKDKSCVCLCPKGDCNNPKYDINCRNLDFKLKNDCVISTYYAKDPDSGKTISNPSTQNCVIKKETIAEKSNMVDVVGITECCT